MGNVWSRLGLAEVNTLRGEDPTTEFTNAAESIRADDRAADAGDHRG